ncbi:hypothetical protein [Pseudorhodoferax sp. Leaf267]|uniref:hypothetical protein n=1 Tax=Pseudorhodoferax sp. Leaf267 TaxID=1736316 RepID=UPI0006FE6C80|nr:hypothetical protein [Pseudorhodoferax sp. Leaf267]KQP14386.1 hypothetical protein ASF43_16410 [Pseudorhodoferax sp. Leaf267]
MHVRTFAIVTIALLLAGCEIPGIYPDPKAVQREADAKATGGGCRHALRALEDCYALNPKAPRAAIFTGWKDMDQYMRDNKIEGVQAVIAAPVQKTEEREESVASTPEKAAPEPRERRSGTRGS